MTTTLREILHERYAVAHNLCEKSVVLVSSTLDRFQLHLGREATFDDLTDLSVIKFLRWRAVTPLHAKGVCRPATTRKDQAHLVSLWNYCAKKRLCYSSGQMVDFPDLPRNLIRVPTRPPKAYRVEEVSALVRAAKLKTGWIGAVPAAWFWPSLIWSLWETGERIGGHLGVTWDDVDLEQRVITFQGASRKDRTTTIQRMISAELVAFLSPQKGDGDKLVWPWLLYRDYCNVFGPMKRLCESCGITPRGFHAIRKASGSYVKRGGGDSQEHLGHANSRTTRLSYDDLDIIGRQSALDYLPPLDLGDRPPAPPAA